MFNKIVKGIKGVYIYILANIIIRLHYDRQCKFIANDARTYEISGFACELPFWDIRICSFGESVPFELLKHRRLQDYFTKAYINRLCGIAESAPLEHEN